MLFCVINGRPKYFGHVVSCHNNVRDIGWHVEVFFGEHDPDEEFGYYVIHPILENCVVVCPD